MAKYSKRSGYSRSDISVSDETMILENFKKHEGHMATAVLMRYIVPLPFSLKAKFWNNTITITGYLC